MDEEKNIKFLTKLRSALEDDAITRQEFVKAFEAVVKIVKDIKDANSKEMMAIHQTITALSNKMQSDVSNEMSSAEKKSMDYCMKEMQKIYKEHEKKISQMDEKMAMVQDGIDGKDADTAEIIKEVLSKVPQTPFLTSVEIRDRLEIFKEEDEKLKIDAIGFLKAKLEELEKKIAQKSGGGVRRVFQPYVDDFSALTNGSTKIFYLSREPLRTDTVQIFGTDFPTILRPTTDFTIAGKKLTLTSAVPAPNTGVTLLAHYFA